MPYERPTLSDLRTQALAAFVAQLPGTDASLRRSNVKVSANVMAGLVNGEYGYQDWLVTQAFPDTCTDEYLARWLAIFGLPSFGTAEPSSGPAAGTGTNGVTLDAGGQLQDANGNFYATTADATVSGGVIAVAVQAVAGGSDGNLAAGAVLTLATAVSGIAPSFIVGTGGLTGGADAETNDQARSRLLARIRQPPQGGAANDYADWPLSVVGVTRVWVLPQNRGPGTVDVTFVMDGREDIIPGDDDVAAVQAAVDAQRPVTDDCVVFAPDTEGVDFTFASITPNNPTVQAAITGALGQLFATVAQVGMGLQLQDQILPAIAGAQGLTGFTLSSPSANVPGVAGTIPVKGNVTFP